MMRKIKSSPIVDEERVKEIAQDLDPDSEKLLWHLWQKRHAQIEELAQAIKSPTHMDVLIKIREIINPRAEKVMGGPILFFEKSRMDYETGEKVLFSWWLMGRERPGKKEFLLDLFDEGDHLNIVMELRGVKEEDIELKVEEDRLLISVPSKGYQEKIRLPVSVDLKNFSKRYNNGILQVKLSKTETK